MRCGLKNKCVLLNSRRCTEEGVSSLSSSGSNRSNIHYRWMFCWSSYEHRVRRSWLQ